MERLKPPTAGTRIAMWVFPALTLYLGLGYLFGAPTRYQSSAFDAARGLMPMRWWGVVFVATAALKVTCLLYGHLRTFVVAMCFGAGLYTCWAFLFAASLVEPTTSWGAPAWPAAVVFMHVAFLATLTGRRVR